MFAYALCSVNFSARLVINLAFGFISCCCVLCVLCSFSFKMAADGGPSRPSSEVDQNAQMKRLELARIFIHLFR